MSSPAPIQVRLSETHVRALTGLAKDASLDTLSYIQRVLQNHVDHTLAVPNKESRTLARLGANALRAGEGLRNATRALEMGDARARHLQQDIEAAVDELRTVIVRIGDAVERVAV